jgi:hypothetical protein
MVLLGCRYSTPMACRMSTTWKPRGVIQNLPLFKAPSVRRMPIPLFLAEYVDLVDAFHDREKL